MAATTVGGDGSAPRIRPEQKERIDARNELDRVEPGFDVDGLTVVRLAPPFQRFDTEEEGWEGVVDSYFQRFVTSIETLPGVDAVAITSNVPLTGDRGNNDVLPEGWEVEHDGVLLAERRFVSVDFFETLGIPILEVRGFDRRDDRRDSAPTVIVSNGLAQRAWPGESAVGRQMAFWGREPATVVGVAADVRDEQLQSATELAFYAPARQVLGYQEGHLIVRSDLDATQLVPAVRSRVWAVDEDVPVTEATALRELVTDAIAPQRYRARLITTFSLLAAVLALLGVYGVTSRAVARRRREMGLRLALGAQRSDVQGLILRHGAGLALLGGVLGLVLAALLSRFLAGFLYGVAALDAISFVASGVAVVAGATVASLPSSRRATAIDPAVSLRED